MGIQKRGRPVAEPTMSVADALFTRVQQRLLALLFGNPERSFYANEIIERARSGSGAAQRQLARLESSGLVTVKRIGNQKHYQANAAAAIFPELRDLVLKTSGLADVLRAALAPFADRLQAAFVYGSIAKREHRATSDIDLMIVSDALAYADVFPALERASELLGRTVNPTIYTPAELTVRRKQGNAFVGKVLKQPKIWIIGTDDDIRTR
jgi:Predicted nucleotidyltransferases